MLHPKLPDIIDGQIARYRIVFMDRDLQEVVSSQRTMLDRDDRKGANLETDKLIETFASQIESVHKMLAQRNIPWLQIRHADAIRDPQAVAAELNKAFGGGLDVEAMVQAADPSFYRERSGPVNANS